MNTVVASTQLVRVVKTTANALVLEVFDGYDRMDVTRWREPVEFDQNLAQELMSLVHRLAPNLTESDRDTKLVSENESDNDIPF